MTRTSRKEIRRTRDQERRRKDFREAAARVFSAQGFHRATMEAIANEAGYGTGTIYRYFRDKEDLYLSLLETDAANLIEWLERSMEEEGSLEDKVHSLFLRKCEFIAMHRDFFRLYLASHYDLAGGVCPGLEPRLRPIRERGERMLHDFFSAASERATLFPADPAKLSFIFISLSDALLFDWLRGEDNESWEEVAELAFGIFWRGIFRPAGL